MKSFIKFNLAAMIALTSVIYSSFNLSSSQIKVYLIK